MINVMNILSEIEAREEEISKCEEERHNITLHIRSLRKELEKFQEQNIGIIAKETKKRNHENWLKKRAETQDERDKLRDTIEWQEWFQELKRKNKTS